MPIEIIHSYAILKKAAAITNHSCGVLSKDKMELISTVCDEIIDGKHNDQFPLVVWQTGSGTQTNMNINEVISNRCQQLLKKDLDHEKYVKANDDVNKSQSSNDTFPTAMHLAAYKLVLTNTLPALRNLKVSLDKKSDEFKDIVKIGRTHMMDATPITLGQEFSAFSKQIENGIISLENSLKFILEIALGGTAVGTGLNTPDGYSEKVAEIIAKETNYPFVSAENKFEALSSNDSLVDCHGSLKKIAVALNKISNDIRMLSSGPRSGIGEIILPANEPGSSIMPGKVNPTQCEAMSMVCSQVVGNDTAITFSASQGHFQLNVFKPVIIYNFINSSKLISDAVNSFNSNCVKGIIPNLKSIKDKLDNSLMLVTALNPKIGYYKAAEIANNAYKNDTTLREEAIKSGYLTNEEYDQLVDPKSMI
jgi:fumarate hydratase class II